MHTIQNPLHSRNQDGQRLRVVELKTIQPHSPRPLTIVGDKVDMLSLIPATTNRGYRLYVDNYEDQEPRLRIWYHHQRGAAHQIELKRYVNMRILGGLLGQLQAEGEKKQNIVSFKNCTIQEHADFVYGFVGTWLGGGSRTFCADVSSTLER